MTSDLSFVFLAVDITVYHKEYHGDLNETFFVGNVDDESKQLVRVTHECLMNAIRAGKINSNRATSLNVAPPDGRVVQY